jgi:hypothetical protein
MDRFRWIALRIEQKQIQQIFVELSIVEHSNISNALPQSHCSNLAPESTQQNLAGSFSQWQQWAYDSEVRVNIRHTSCLLLVINSFRI